MRWKCSEILRSLTRHALLGNCSGSEIDTAATAAGELAEPESAAAPKLERIWLPASVKKKLMEDFLRDVHHYLFNVSYSPRPGETYQVQDWIRHLMIEALTEGAKVATDRAASAGQRAAEAERADRDLRSERGHLDPGNQEGCQQQFQRGRKHSLISRFPVLPDGSARFRRRLAFNPGFAVLEDLLLPDRHGLFQAINRVMAGFKGDAAMR